MPYVESGALYRAITLAALDNDVELSGARLVGLARTLPVRLDMTPDGPRPEVAGVDVSQAIREPRVTALVSRVSAIPEVRQWVNRQVREAVSAHAAGAVLEGRDIGTVVFPDAPLKVFLTAQPDERARRRLLQEGRETGPDAVALAAEQLRSRDDADASRAVAPLRPAEDAIVLDTTRLSFEEQVQFIVDRARKVFSSLDIQDSDA
jgi:cytidylate kinase